MPFLKPPQTAVINQLVYARKNGQNLFAILIDPEETKAQNLPKILKQLPATTTYILVGGSTATRQQMTLCVNTLKKYTSIPVILFPGNHDQLVPGADALFFLSLISGRNPDYLIEEQVKAIPFLKKHQLDVLPTGYILINGGNVTRVQQVSQTLPLEAQDVDKIVNTALAGQYLGMQLIYLETGSGAKDTVGLDVVRAVSNAISIPLVVGGGIRSRKKVDEMYQAGATMVVVGTAFEQGKF